MLTHVGTIIKSCRSNSPLPFQPFKESFVHVRAGQSAYLVKYPTKTLALSCICTHLLTVTAPSAAFKPPRRSRCILVIFSMVRDVQIRLLLLYITSFVLSLASPISLLLLSLSFSCIPCIRRNSNFKRPNDEVSIGNATS